MRSGIPFGRVAHKRHTALAQRFKIERRTATREGGGRTFAWEHDTTVGDPNDAGFCTGVLASASSRDIVLAERSDLNVSHQIILTGAFVLRRGDHRLVLHDPTVGSANDPRRYFTVESTENPGNLGTVTLLQVNERRPTE